MHSDIFFQTGNKQIKQIKQIKLMPVALPCEVNMYQRSIFAINQR
jgi:hypothetical protein